MCGIVGYIGKNNPKNILIECLKKLEYRGYDSSGIALFNNSDVQVIKSVGKIKNLEEKLEKVNLIESYGGIAHTRWATHGSVTEENAHPHVFGRITLVHNGIIENAGELKEKLISEGYKFKSETDTEVIACLIDKYYSSDIVDAINLAICDLRGSYALCIIVKGDNKIYAIKKDSPLVIGLGEDEIFLSSDITAFSKYTNKYILVDDFELVVIDDEMHIYKDNKTIKKEIMINDEFFEVDDKNGYDHYMLKEIMEEPDLVDNLLNKIGKIPDLSKYSEIHILGCGSAYYAGVLAKSLMEEYSEKKIICELASEYRYKKVIYDENTLVILISQSGETADTIAALRKAKLCKVNTLAIVNVKTSTIARESDMQIFIEAKSEKAVATTKAFMLQVLVLSLLSLQNSNYKDDVKIISEFKTLRSKLREILSRRDEYLSIAKLIYKHNNLMFIGRKIDYALCLEGSLKLKEISYIHSEAYQAGELKHGTISLINEGFYLFGIISDDTIFDKTLANIEEAKSRGAIPIVISNKDVNYDYKVVVDKVNPFMQSLLIIPVLQLIAYETAKLKDCDIDKPKNLAKSVTVE